MTVLTHPGRAVPNRLAESPRRQHQGLLADAGQMTLCVRGPGQEGRTVQIRSAKCTIGSAAGCTLRLRARGVGPLHCWILRGPGGAIVRRMHGPAMLNGGKFEEAALKKGDKLRLGSVELELVEFSQQPATPPPLFTPPPRPSEAEINELKTKLAAEAAVRAEEAVRAQITALRAELAAAVERAAKLEGESRQGFQASITAAERADQLRDALMEADEQLESTSAELAKAQETLARQAKELDAQQQQLNELKNNAAATADQERGWLEAEVEQARTVLANEKERWQTERTQLQRRLQQRDAELAALRNGGAGHTSPMTEVFSEQALHVDEELQARCDELETKCTELEARCAALQARSAEPQARCAELEQKLAAAQDQIEPLRRLVGEYTIIEGRFEKLTRDYDQKCIALEELQTQAAAAGEAKAGQADEVQQRAEALTKWQEELASREERVTQQKQELDNDWTATRALQEELIASRRQLEADRDALQLERDQIQSQRDELERDRQELDAQRAALAAEHQNAAVGQHEMERLQSREAQIGEQAAELQQQVAAANSRLAELEQLQQQLAEERVALDERGQQLSQLQQEIDAKGEDLEQRVAQLESLQQRLDLQAESQSQIAAEDASRPRLAIQPTAEPDQPAQASAPEPEKPVSSANVTAPWQPIQRPSAATDPEDVYTSRVSQAIAQHLSFVEQAQAATAPPPPEEASVDSVLSRLVRSGVWREGESLDSGKAPPAASAAPEEPVAPTDTADIAPPSPSPVSGARPAHSPTGKGPTHGEDESIESYMERLMQRVRGDAPASQMAFKPVGKDQVESRPATAAPAAPAEPTEPESDEYSPRRTAPELSTTMTAMRDLANSAARSAIDQHVRKHTGKQAASKVFTSLLTIAASGLLSYWAWKTFSLQAAVGAGIGGLVGTYWLFAAIRRLFILMRLNNAGKQQAEAPAETKAS